MKRSELKVGESYYYDQSSNWGKYGPGGDRAVVVDDKRYTIVRSTWVGSRLQDRYREDPKGTAVLVDIHRAGREGPDRDAVPVAHLRGPWESTVAEVTARHEAERQRVEAARNAEKDLRRRADAAVEQVRSLGAAADVCGGYGQQIRIEMSVEAFERLVEQTVQRAAEPS